MRSLRSLITDVKQELNMPDQSFCGPALTDHDWTMHGECSSTDPKSSRPWSRGIGIDIELMKTLFDFDNTAYAECNWCAHTYERKVVEDAEAHN